jgi:carboxyl-terminal processing protease
MKRSRAAYLLGVVGLLFLVGVWLSRAESKDNADTDKAKTLTPQQRQRNLESFEVVWQTVRDKHWDAKLGGVDWQAVHDELRPRMEKATTSERCEEILTDMIRRLGQSHFEIIPEQAYADADKKPGSTDKKATNEAANRGTTGMSIRVVNDLALVVKVQPESPAAKLGVRPGWQILKIQDQEVGAMLGKLRNKEKHSHFLDYQLWATVAEKLEGNIGQKMTVVFDKGMGGQTTLSVALTEPSGVPARFGNLPTIHVSYDSHKLEGNIEYFSLTVFLDPPRVMKAFEEAVKANLSADGFILDLRGNPGGIGAMTIGFGNWFVREPNQKLGTLYTREATLKFTLHARAQTFQGPLAILVDGQTASASEILAGGLQDLKRARIFGTRTAGQALPAQVIRLPNGDRFMFAFANYISAGGQPLEARGVRPDVEVPLSRQALLKGEDPALNAAVTWIQSQKNGSVR